METSDRYDPVMYNVNRLVPTRWGNQLNGNSPLPGRGGRVPRRHNCPHSLGKPIKWKPESTMHTDELGMETSWSPLAGETN